MNQKRAEEKVHQIIEQNKDELVKTLSELVQVKTTVGQEAQGQEFMKKLYSDLNLKVVALEADYDKVSKHRGFSYSEVPYEGRPNIIGVFEGDPGARSLILNGHLDVVPVQEAEEKNWEYPPWEGKVVGKRLYGRGAGDMKSGLLANYFALKSILQAGFKPKGTVILESAIEEEASGGGGTLACFVEGYTADGFICTDGPSPVLKYLGVGTGGLYWFRVKVMGKPAHAAVAHLGVNAISEMNKICDALFKLGERRAKEKAYPLFFPKSVICNFTIGKYRAGDWPSSVASWAEIECRIGQVPGEERESIRQEVQQVIDEVAKSDEWLKEHSPVIEWFGVACEPWVQDTTHPLVTSFKACVERVLGRELEFTGSGVSTDARFAQYYNVPALVFAPAGGNAHGTNEYVDLDSLMDFTKVLASFTIEWCGIE